MEGFGTVVCRGGAVLRSVRGSDQKPFGTAGVFRVYTYVRPDHTFQVREIRVDTSDFTGTQRVLVIDTG